jgi:citrate/tricarballylate utilization protein
MMQQLNSLIREASDLGNARADQEVARVMQICNACRYCEGFCAVFPAMTRRIEFNAADVHYLANLCHNCGACLHACQYAPPHDFAVNVPLAMAKVRQETYIDFAWPHALGSLYKKNGITVALASSISLIVFLLVTLVLNGTLFIAPNGGNFYAIFSHNTLVLMFGSIFLFAIFALSLGVIRFWRQISPGSISGAAAAEATHDALTLKYLGGGHGKGCNNEDDAFSLWRKRFHHFTLGLSAPYALNSLPVILGTVGGIGLLIGPAGLLYLNYKRDSAHGDVNQKPMDRAFILLLWLISASGLGLLAYRDTSWMSIWLAVHLGFVMSFFLTMPYGKFAHGIYRTAALLKNAIEKRQKSNLQLGTD